MGWEFAALWVDEPELAWKWRWRRVADDGGNVLEESNPFDALDACVEDARRHGFDESCGPVQGL